MKMMGSICVKDRELEDIHHYRIPEMDYIANFSRSVAAQIINNEHLKNDSLKILGFISLYLNEALKNE
jgi:hypothetical protein